MNIKIEPPERYTPWNVMFWEPKSKELLVLKKNGDVQATSLLNKARIFLGEGLIEKHGEDYICKPIKGYNKSIYLIEKGICNCQGFNKNGYCSHALAVDQFKFMEEK